MNNYAISAYPFMAGKTTHLQVYNKSFNYEMTKFLVSAESEALCLLLLSVKKVAI